jgi:hypothetical protein
MSLEPFVSADVAAKSLGINRRFLQEMARGGIKGAYPVGAGRGLRKRWVFLLSELVSSIKSGARGRRR